MAATIAPAASQLTTLTQAHALRASSSVPTAQIAAKPLTAGPKLVSRNAQANAAVSRRPSFLAASVALQEAETEVKAVKEEVAAAEAEDDATEAPSAFEIQSLLMELCDETKIAELKVKVGSFLLHVKRDVGGKKAKAAKAAAAAPVYVAPPVPSAPMSEALASASAATPAAPAASAEEKEAVDEGLLYVTAPKVGIIRRGRVHKGKRGRNLVDEGSTVKVGQVVCYLEQLGTQLAIESEHAGEVVKFVADEGDAVGFGDQLIAIRPSFPGIKKLA